MASLGAILKAIRESELSDQELAIVADAAHQRRIALARQAAAELGVGDLVKLVRIKPKYMQGVYVTIVERQGNKFLVQLPGPIGKFQGTTLLVHETCVEKGP
jgi:hypothetical protein